MTQEPTTTPDEALATLMEGARRAQEGVPQRPNSDVARREALARGQNPIAAVIGCSDSRVPMEYAMDAGYGDLFAIRTAGHTLGETVIGSIEFAVDVLGVPLLMVLGHTSCGAVTSAAETLDGARAPGGNVASLVERILPSVIEARAEGKNTVAEAVAVHSRRTVERLRDLSPALARAEDAGRLRIVAAVYDLATGAVTLVD